jgi:hypothetical protein
MGWDPSKIHRCRRGTCKDQFVQFATDAELQGHIGGKHYSSHDRTEIEHGTVSGYKKEVHRGLTTCPKCRKAWRFYVRSRRAKKEDQRG